MPTRRRHQETETRNQTDDLASARTVWPDETPSAQIEGAAHFGDTVMRNQEDAQLRARREAMKQLAGKWTGTFGPTFLDELREGKL
ncbi:MAG: hypothetical protein LBM23_01935 [Propionibacteriaceae bacterium]|jgi:hypothetical protein|nr:hypothetical protein [Propionibacteriaceae bacterium]